MALKGFNVMLQAEDAVGPCFVAYGVVAETEEQARGCKRLAAQVILLL